MRTSTLMTVGGLMGVVGGLPLAVQFAHLTFPLPLWWNACQFPLFLIGLIGVGIVGFAGKGADDHSTEPQIQAATAKAVVANVEAKVADPTKDPTLEGKP